MKSMIKTESEIPITPAKRIADKTRRILGLWPVLFLIFGLIQAYALACEEPIADIGTDESEWELICEYPPADEDLIGEIICEYTPADDDPVPVVICRYPPVDMPILTAVQHLRDGDAHSAAMVLRELVGISAAEEYSRNTLIVAVTSLDGVEELFGRYDLEVTSKLESLTMCIVKSEKDLTTEEMDRLIETLKTEGQIIGVSKDYIMHLY